MAAPNPIPNPIRIEYPPGGHKRDALTGGGDGQFTFPDTVNPIVLNSIHGPLPQDPEQGPVCLTTNPTTTCYRNAALNALLGLKPFVNFLNQATVQLNDPQTSTALLNSVANSYFNPGRSRASRTSDVRQPINRWFREVRHNGVGQGPVNAITRLSSWDQQMSDDGTAQADPVEFLNYLLDRMELELAAHLPYPNAMKRLFRPQYIRRYAYECSCDEKVRQPASHEDRSTWTIDIAATNDQTSIADLISQRTHDSDSVRRGNCPNCGAQDQPIHEYRKFQWLPEVFLLSIQYIDSATGIFSTDVPATDMPDTVDLSALQDYQTSLDSDQSGARYQLETVIAYDESDDQGGSGHYRAHVRRHDGTWDQVDERANPRVRNQAQLKFSDDFRPRLLAYVRQHKPQPDAVDLKYFQIQQADHTPDGSPSGSQAIDASSWNVARLKRELKALHIAVGTMGRDKLLLLWNNFQNANADDKLTYLLKDELNRRATVANLDLGTKKPSKDDLVKALIKHQQAQPQSPDQQTPPVSQQAQVSDQQAQSPHQQPQKAAQQDQTTDQQAIGAIPIDPMVGVKPSASVVAPADNTQLGTEVDNLRSENADLRRQLQIWQDAAARAQRRLAASNTVIPHLGAASAAGSAALQNQTQNDQVPGHTVSTPPTNITQHTQTPSQQHSGTQRVLKVTVPGIIDPIDNDSAWDDYHFYIPVPGYISEKALTTSQWWRLEKYLPEGMTAPEDVMQRIVVFIAVRGQDGTAATVYKHHIGLGYPIANQPIEPRVTVDLLHSRASQQAVLTSDVTVIRAPSVTTAQQSPLPSVAAPTTQTRPSTAQTPQTTADTPSLVSAGPYLSIGVKADPQMNGHGLTKHDFRLPLPDYNMNEKSVTHVTVRMVAANGSQPAVQNHGSHGDIGTHTVRLQSEFGPVVLRTPSPTNQVGSGSGSGSDRTLSTGSSSGIGGNTAPRGQTRRRSQDDDDDDHDTGNDTDQHRDRRVRTTGPVDTHAPAGDDDIEGTTFVPDDIASSPPVITQLQPNQPPSPQLPQLPQQPQQPQQAQGRAQSFSIKAWAAEQYQDVDWNSALTPPRPRRRTVQNASPVRRRRLSRINPDILPALPPPVIRPDPVPASLPRTPSSSSPSPPQSPTSPIYSGTASTPATGLSTMLSRMQNDSSPARRSITPNLEQNDAMALDSSPVPASRNAAPLVNQLVASSIAQAAAARGGPSIDDGSTALSTVSDTTSQQLQVHMEVDILNRNSSDARIIDGTSDKSDKSNSDPMMDLQHDDIDDSDLQSMNQDIGNDSVMSELSHLGLRSRTPTPEDMQLDLVPTVDTSIFSNTNNNFNGNGADGQLVNFAPPPSDMIVEYDTELQQDLPDYIDVDQDTIIPDADFPIINPQPSIPAPDAIDNSHTDLVLADQDSMNIVPDDDDNDSLISSDEADTLQASRMLTAISLTSWRSDSSSPPQGVNGNTHPNNNNANNDRDMSPESPLRIPPATLGSDAVIPANLVAQPTTHLDDEVTRFLNSIDTSVPVNLPSSPQLPESPLVLPPASPAQPSSAGGMANMYGQFYTPGNRGTDRVESWRDPRLIRLGLGGVDPNADVERVGEDGRVPGDDHDDVPDVIGANVAGSDDSDSDSDQNVQHRGQRFRRAVDPEDR